MKETHKDILEGVPSKIRSEQRDTFQKFYSFAVGTEEILVGATDEDNHVLLPVSVQFYLDSQGVFEDKAREINPNGLSREDFEKYRIHGDKIFDLRNCQLYGYAQEGEE